MIDMSYFAVAKSLKSMFVFLPAATACLLNKMKKPEVTVGVETLDDDDERIEDIIEEFETEDLEEIENHPD